MIDYQTLIDKMLAAVDMPDLPLDQLQGLSGQYAEACADANQRLARCGQFLRVGNSAEAIRLADSTPPLLDICNILDYSDRDEWFEMCKSLHLAVPAVINHTIVEQLNNAYNLYYNIEDLLKENRKLALLRAPLDKRLNVLRQLAEKEPQNIIWSEMIDEYEKIRIEELGTAFQKAKKSEDPVSAITAIGKELESTKWTNSPPESLLREVKNWLDNSAFQLGLIQLRGTAERLHKAFRDNDLENAKTWNGQWNDYLRQKKIPYAKIPNEIKKYYVPAANWIKECDAKKERERRLDEKILLLKEEIQSENDIDTIIAHFNTLEKLLGTEGRMIPSDVFELYAARIKDHQRKKRQKQFFITGIAGLTGLIMLVSILFFAKAYAKYGRIKKTFQQADIALNDYQTWFETGSGTVDSSDHSREILSSLVKDYPELSGDPRYANIEARAKKLDEEDNQRKDNLKDLMKKAEDSLMVSDSSGDIVPKPALLSEMENLIRSSEEKKNYEDLKKKFEIMFTLQRGKMEKKVQNLVEQISQKIDSLKKNQSLSPEELLGESDTIKAEISKLDGYKVFDKDLAEKIGLYQQNLQTELGTVVSDTEKEIEIRKELNGITEKIGFLPQFLEELEKHSAQYPQSSITRDLATIKKEKEAQDIVSTWNTFIEENYRLFSQYGDTRKESDDFFAAFEKIKNADASIPEVADVEQHMDQFQALIAAGGRQTITETLDRFLSNYNTPLWCCIHKEAAKENYYYFANNPSGEKITYKKSGIDPDDPHARSLTEEELGNMKEAPHYLAVSECIQLMRPVLAGKVSYTMFDWYKMINEILLKFNPQKFDGMDPLIKIFFLRNIIDILNSDPFCAKYISPIKKALEHPSANYEIDWLNPESDQMDEQRILARQLLGNLQTEFGNAGRIIEEAHLFVIPFNRKYEWIGFLRDYQGSWSLVKKEENPLGSGALYICRKPDQKGNAQFIEIGYSSDDEYKIDEEAHKNLLSGLPVYISRNRDFPIGN
ncbi:MAG: hypothetical protein Q4G69_02735 [Planctomycetia bacterium]|nr:hypothetical protein [Planctomycetia bacterium]